MNGTKKIFIADDDRDILEILEMMLHTRGYRVNVSDNAGELFDYRPEQLPDLILLDIWMSGIDGRDICARLKKSAHTKHIPVLFISANSNIQSIAKEYCAEGYIAKPFDMDTLLNKIKDVLEVKRV
jgi:DNA-binding response OmpR family regulator